MSDIGADLITYLKTVSTVTDLVGSGTAAKIYEEDPKQAVALPYVVFEVFEGISQQHLTGISGLARNRIQIDAYAATRTAANALAEALRLALAGFRGNFDSTLVRETGRTSYRRGRDKPTDGGNQRRYWVSRDYIFTYDESIS
jgi:hypothetical protein